MAIYKELVANTRKLVSEIDKAGLSGDLVLIDIREPYEFEKGAIPNSINIPRGRLEFDIEEHPSLKEKFKSTEELLQADLVLYCKSDSRSVLATKALNDIGFTKVCSLLGGYDNWIK